MVQGCLYGCHGDNDDGWSCVLWVGHGSPKSIKGQKERRFSDGTRTARQSCHSDRIWAVDWAGNRFVFG